LFSDNILKSLNLESYLKYRNSVAEGAIKFSYFAAILWCLVLIASLWRYIRVVKGDHELINHYIEKLFPYELEYPFMLKRIKIYAFSNVLICILIITGSLLFPSVQVHWLSTSLFVLNQKAQQTMYKNSLIN
jgi:hypothetical protein